MNKLEELINEHFGKQPVDVAFGMVEMKIFILSLNLPVKFAEWKDNFVFVKMFEVDGRFKRAFVLEDKDTFDSSDLIFSSNKELEQYWLNNVYDGK